MKARHYVLAFYINFLKFRLTARIWGVRHFKATLYQIVICLN